MKKFNFKQLSIICLIILLNLNTAIAAPTGQTIYDYFVNGTAKSDLNFTDITNNLLGTIVWIGYAAAVCVILIIGIQFLIATPQKKAQLKEKLWFILVGVIILVAGVTILNVVSTIMQSTVSQ